MTKRFAARTTGDMTMADNAIPVQVKIYYTMDVQIATKMFRKRSPGEAGQGNLRGQRIPGRKGLISI